jgi:ElaB/YqjD/DUF883 family membrane-anchored ribosome-binding protein
MSDSESKPSMKDALRDAGDRARAGIEDVQRMGRDVIATTREKGEALIVDTREKGYRAAAETNRLFQEHPRAAVAAATAAGAVLGIFLPRLMVTAKASKLAGQAFKAAMSSQTSKKLRSSMRESGDQAPNDEAQAETDESAPRAG